MTAPPTCPNCGATVTQGDAFCGVCGEFLAWDADPPPPAGSGAADGAAAPARGPASDARPTPIAPPGAGTIPVAGPGATGQPGTVLPGRPVAARPVVREFTDVPADLDAVTCPVCGTANRRGGRFCRRCGAALGPAAPAAARLPWWRRLRWPRLRLGGLATLLRWLLIMITALAVAVAAGYVIRRYGPGAVEAVRDRVARPERISPTAVIASSEAPGHPASQAVDGLSNRYWAPAAPGPADGQYLELTFDGPFRLLDVIVYPGASTQQDQFAQQARPAVLELTAWSSDGRSTSWSLHLADQPGEQRFRHAVGAVVRLRCTIRSSYGTGGDRHAAVAEIELFRRP